MKFKVYFKNNSRYNFNKKKLAMAEVESPTPMTNDELVEACLILIQKLHSENRINETERDHLKGKLVVSE